MKMNLAREFKRKFNSNEKLRVLVQTRSQFPDVAFEVNEINSQLHAIYFERYQKVYEPDIECCMELILPQTTTFIDVGANWGYFVGKAALMRPDLELIAFEPASLSFADLKSLCDGLNTNICAFQQALGEKEGTATITQPGFETGLASLVQNTSQKKNCGYGEEVDVKTLDSLNFSQNTFIKIDVEGFEMQVLNGGRKIISKEKPCIIFEHWHFTSADMAPFFDFFDGLGYVLFAPIVSEGVQTKTELNDSSVIFDFRLGTLQTLACDRRYNLLAIHPSTEFFDVFKPYLSSSESSHETLN